MSRGSHISPSGNLIYQPQYLNCVSSTLLTQHSPVTRLHSPDQYQYIGSAMRYPAVSSQLILDSRSPSARKGKRQLTNKYRGQKPSFSKLPIENRNSYPPFEIKYNESNHIERDRVPIQQQKIYFESITSHKKSNSIKYINNNYVPNEQDNEKKPCQWQRIKSQYAHFPQQTYFTSGHQNDRNNPNSKYAGVYVEGGSGVNFVCSTYDPIRPLYSTKPCKSHNMSHNQAYQIEKEQMRLSQKRVYRTYYPFRSIIYPSQFTTTEY